MNFVPSVKQILSKSPSYQSKSYALDIILLQNRTKSSLHLVPEYDIMLSEVIPLDSKVEALKANGTYNEDSQNVQAEHFKHGIFFDPHDIVQVKYEMIRCVEKDGTSIRDAASLYGFSRQTFYACRDAINEEGISGLIPKKSGPKTGYKLDEDRKRLIDRYLSDHPRAKAQEIHNALEKELDVQVTVKTISRYLAKKV